MTGITKRCFVTTIVAAFLCFAGQPLQAITLDVNSTTDLGDSNPGDGECSASGPFCTLRAAIEEANALGGSNRINVPAGSYILSLGALAISSDITIVGAGSAVTIIDGAHASRICEVNSSASSLLSHVTFSNAYETADDGGGLYINPGCTVRIQDCVFSNNICENHRGGAVANEGTLIIERSTFAENESHHGGAINSRGSLTATEVVVSDNVAVIGGGVSGSGTINLTDVTFSGNEALGDVGSVAGGGLFLAETAVAVLERVTFVNNLGLSGGGIYDMASSLTMTNVTFNNNRGRVGGGALTVSGYSHSDVTIANVTIAGNIDDGYGGGAILWDQGSATVAIVNSIFADNGTAQCNLPGVIFSFGHNLETTNSCGFAVVGDQVNTPADLAPLADNGGLTQTMALLPTSAAIDSGDDLPAPATDQRGVARPQDGNDDGSAVTDIGAYEYADKIFSDDFESSDVSMWSTHVP